MKKTIILTMLCLLLGCASDGVGATNWVCEVTLTLVPSTFGSNSSPSGSGRGTGQGSTRQEALDAAYRTACSQLPLDGATQAVCEAGGDFNVEGGSSGNMRLFSAVERSTSCRSETSS